MTESKFFYGIMGDSGRPKFYIPYHGEMYNCKEFGELTNLDDHRISGAIQRMKTRYGMMNQRQWIYHNGEELIEYFKGTDDRKHKLNMALSRKTDYRPRVNSDGQKEVEVVQMSVKPPEKLRIACYAKDGCHAYDLWYEGTTNRIHVYRSKSGYHESFSNIQLLEAMGKMGYVNGTSRLPSYSRSAMGMARYTG